MDISKEYIKMCEEAKEIQEQLGAINFDGRQNRGLVVGNGCFFYGKDDVNGTIIWLPRQDQLQEIYDKDFGTCLERIWDYKESCENYYYENLISMEQVWLHIVMKEKFHKIWDGKKWKKQKNRNF